MQLVQKNLRDKIVKRYGMHIYVKYMLHNLFFIHITMQFVCCNQAIAINRNHFDR